MLLSLAVILITGIVFGFAFKKIHLPALTGMLIAGIIIGPHALDLISPSLTDISTELRQIALIIILTRAGLSLNLADLKKVGRPALLMCFVPSVFELIGVVLLAPRLLDVTVLDALIIGFVIAAVSPAVIVPRMLKISEEGYGIDKKIPQMITAGTSIDDVFVIILFTALMTVYSGETIAAADFDWIQIPISVMTGIAVGVLTGLSLSILFKKAKIENIIKVITLLCISFIFITAENMTDPSIPFSGLLAIMTAGIILFKFNRPAAGEISLTYSKLWIPAEIIVFVLIGAAADISYSLSAGIMTVVVIAAALMFRAAGVFVCLLKTELNMTERLFCMIAYMPKATVQATIGGIPLAMGLPCGPIVLAMAVISILITAPLGAWAIEKSYKQLLRKDKDTIKNEEQMRDKGE